MYNKKKHLRKLNIIKIIDLNILKGGGNTGDETTATKPTEILNKTWTSHCV